MPKIYELSIESGADIISYSSLPNENRLSWLFFDSSIFVELTNYFVDGGIKVLSQDYISLINYLSTNNINIHPFALIEAARDKEHTELKLRVDRAKKHLYAMLLAQCVDIHTYPLTPLSGWKISRERIRLLLKEYPFEANSLFRLAEQMFNHLFASVEKDIKSLQAFKNDIVNIFLQAAWRANKLRGSNFEKLSFFFSQIPKKPYLPKIVDFCIRIIIIPNEELLVGTLGKIKTELDNTALDIAIFEHIQQGNFIEPFHDRKPQVFFYTSDRNLFYYAKLGRPLVISLPNFKKKFYYPDLTFLENDKKLLKLSLNYFKLNSPQDLKEIILEHIQSDLKNYHTTQGLEFLTRIQKKDFSSFSIFQNASKYNHLSFR